MSIEIVAWIGVVGWVHFWIEHRHYNSLYRSCMKAHDGWRDSLDEQEKLIHICKMQARLLEQGDNEGEAWKNQ